jgi:transketolase
MPNMRVISLADQQISAAMPKFCLDNPGLKYLRLDAQVLPVVYGESLPDLNDGFAVNRSGKKLCLLATGYLLHTALKASEALGERGYSVGVIDLFDLSRFNEAKLLKALSGYDTVVTMEEGFVGRGGMDAMMFNFMARSNTAKRIVNMGVEGGYRFEIGERNSLHEQVGIGLNSVVSKVSQLLG